VRHCATESNIIPFPFAHIAGEDLLELRREDDSTERLPIGLCLVIWTVLSLAGWGAIDAAVKLI
jgi:hypothetical protein